MNDKQRKVLLFVPLIRIFLFLQTIVVILVKSVMQAMQGIQYLIIGENFYVTDKFLRLSNSTYSIFTLF